MSLFPATAFSSLPENCPLLWGTARWEAVAVQVGGSIAIRRQGRRLPSTRLVSPEQVQVDLSDPADARAFAPELIAGVKGRTRSTTPQCLPSATWHSGLRRWLLVDYITDADSVVSYEPTTVLLTGNTPAECLLAGLTAAIEAAKKGGAP